MWAAIRHLPSHGPADDTGSPEVAKLQTAHTLTAGQHAGAGHRSAAPMPSVPQAAPPSPQRCCGENTEATSTMGEQFQ